MTIRQLLKACDELSVEQLDMNLGIVLLKNDDDAELYLDLCTYFLSELGLSDLCDEDIPCIVVKL